MPAPPPAAATGQRLGTGGTAAAAHDVAIAPAAVATYLAYSFLSSKTGKLLPDEQTRCTHERYSAREWRPGWRKPRTGMIEQAMLDAHLVDPAQCLMIGYSQDDAECARKLGCDFLFSDPSKQAPGVFEHWKELEKEEVAAARKRNK